MNSLLWHLGFSSLTGIEPAPSALEAWSQPLGHQGSPESKDRQTSQETLVGQTLAQHSPEGQDLD